MVASQEEKLKEIEKMIDNPVNVKILSLLDNKERLYLGDICRELQISSRRGLKHIEVLKKLKLIEKHKDSAQIQLNIDQYNRAKILFSIL